MCELKSYTDDESLTAMRRSIYAPQYATLGGSLKAGFVCRVKLHCYSAFRRMMLHVLRIAEELKRSLNQTAQPTGMLCISIAHAQKEAELLT